MAQGRRQKLELIGGKKPQMRAKKGGWTAAKRKAFLAELAATCNIAASLRKVKMSRQGLDKLRERSAEFRAGIVEAIRHAYPNLELALLDRSLNGTVKTVTRPDGSVDKTHEYPNAVALSLLRLHKATAEEAEAEHDPDEMEEVHARLMRKLAAVKKRMEAERGAAVPAEAGEEG